MSQFVALASIATGVAYIALGGLVFGEALALLRKRGVSLHGLAITAMAATCGPHHLVHGLHVWRTGHVSTPLLITTIVAAPAGLVVAWLRVEVLLGGRGDRFITGTPKFLAIVPFAYAAAAGLAIGAILDGLTGAGRPDHGAPHVASATIGITSPQFLSNMYTAVAYGIVGWLFVRTQLRRRTMADGWSLSGVSLGGLFSTCALTHLAAASATGHDQVPVAFDVLGVPAATMFLVVSMAVARDSLSDWNRRPLVGTSVAPARPSPWHAGAS